MKRARCVEHCREMKREIDMVDRGDRIRRSLGSGSITLETDEKKSNLHCCRLRWAVMRNHPMLRHRPLLPRDYHLEPFTPLEREPI
jgi:hypothetical protein